MKKSEIICFIPARSGSTRIKNKNIRLINGRPLIYWTVSKAIKSKKFDRIIFSSDSDNYYNILTKYLKKDKLNYKNFIVSIVVYNISANAINISAKSLSSSSI